MREQSALGRFASDAQRTKERLLRAASNGQFLDEPPQPAPDGPGYRSDSTGEFVGYAIDEHQASRATDTGRITDLSAADAVSPETLKRRYGAPDGGDRDAAQPRERVDASAPGNDTFLLEDQVEAGVEDSDVGREFVSAAGESRDLSVAPDEAFGGVGATSGRSIGGFNGTYGGEESPVSEPTPPDAAIEEQDRLVDRDKRERAAERQNALDPQSDADPFEYSAEGIGESVELFGGDR